MRKVGMALLFAMIGTATTTSAQKTVRSLTA